MGCVRRPMPCDQDPVSKPIAPDPSRERLPSTQSNRHLSTSIGRPVHDLLALSFVGTVCQCGEEAKANTFAPDELYFATPNPRGPHVLEKVGKMCGRAHFTHVWHPEHCHELALHTVQTQAHNDMRLSWYGTTATSSVSTSTRHKLSGHH